MRHQTLFSMKRCVSASVMAESAADTHCRGELNIFDLSSLDEIGSRQDAHLRLAILPLVAKSGFWRSRRVASRAFPR